MRHCGRVLFGSILLLHHYTGHCGPSWITRAGKVVWDQFKVKRVRLVLRNRLAWWSVPMWSMRDVRYGSPLIIQARCILAVSPCTLPVSDDQRGLDQRSPDTLGKLELAISLRPASQLQHNSESYGMPTTSIPVVHSPLVHCTLYTVQCTLYIIQCTTDKTCTGTVVIVVVHCTLFTVHCTIYTGSSVQCTLLCSLLCTLLYTRIYVYTSLYTYTLLCTMIV